MITVTKEHFLTAINAVSKAVANPPRFAPLGSLLITPNSNGSLTLVGGDLEVEITSNCEAEVADGAMPFTAPAKKLGAVVKTLPNDTAIKLELANEGNVLLVISNYGKSRLNIVPVQDFVSITRDVKITGSFAIESGVLKSLLNNAISTMPKNDRRYEMNSTYLHSVKYSETANSSLAVAATNGHCLAVWEVPTQNTLDYSILLPYKYAQILVKDIPNNNNAIQVGYSEVHCQVQWGNTTLVGKLINGKFPDYRRVIPATSRYSFLINTKDAVSLLKRALTLKDKKKEMGVKLFLTTGQLEVTATVGDDSFKESLVTEYEGTDASIGINAMYLLNALIALDSDNVVMQFSSDSEPLVLVDPDDAKHMHIIMPMRL